MDISNRTKFCLFSENHTPTTPTTPTTLATSWINLSIEMKTKTSWGDWSLVEAYLSSLRAILVLWPADEIQMIYLVSGACIPVRPLIDLFQQTVNMVGLYNEQKMTNIPSDNFAISKIFLLKKHYQLHDQWLAVDGSTAEKLVDFNFTPIKNLDDHYDRKGKLYHKLLTKCKLQKFIEERKSWKLFVPDSYAIASALNFLGIPYVDKFTTFEFRPYPDLGRPIEWNPKSDEKMIIAADPKYPINFTEALEVAKVSGAFFFRKVGRGEGGM